MAGAKRTHRAPARGPRRRGLAAIASLTSLAVVFVLVVVALHMRGAQTDTGIDTAAQGPVGTLGHRATRTPQATSATSAAASAAPQRHTATSRDSQRPHHAPPPQTIVHGPLLKPLTPAQIASLRAAAEAKAKAEAKAEAVAKLPVTFSIGTFNVLGSQHTGPHGDDHRSWPSASWRTPQEAGYIKDHNVDIVGLQEAQPDQLNTLLNLTGWKAFPGYAFGSNNTDNSIIYDPDKFEFVSGTHFDITFMHAVRPQTVLKLRDKATGRELYFINMHTSAHNDAHDTATRHAGMAKAVSYINGLKSTGLPIFVTGDMNDREQFRSRVLGPANLEAAIDGPWSSQGKHFGSSWLAVDWIASTQGVGWSDYWVSEPQARKVSDHYFISADATIPAAG